MDPRPQASFIPKKPLMEHSSVSLKQPSSISLLMIIAAIIFIISLCLAGGVFAYNSYLNSEIASLNAKINSIEQQFSSSAGSLSTYTRMDDRLKTAALLLQNHIAVSGVFPVLEQNIAQNVQLNSFSFSFSNATTTPSISFSGVAKSYNTLSVQSSVLSASPVIEDPVFSGISLNSSGGVLFSVSASLNPEVVNYSNSLPPVSNTQASSTSASAVSSTSTPAGGQTN